MITVEKQIEEMAKTMLEASTTANVEPVLDMEGKEVVLGENATKILNNILEQAYIPFLAEVIYNAGYRLASDVVEEMAEYIRKDEAVALLEKYRIELPSTYSAGLTTAKNAVRGMPIADVVPRKEYADLVYKLEVVLLSATGILSKHTYDLETMTQAVQDRLNEFYNDGYGAGSAEVAREIIAEIDNALHDMAIEYDNAGHPEYFAVCEMVYHKVIRPIEKKYAEGGE